METKLYVGNLTYETTESDLQTLFEQSGTVKSVQIIKDRDTGRSKGFGFVEMTTQEEAQNAIKALSGKDVGGRPLTVNLAKPRAERGGGGRGFGGGRGRGRGGGGGGGRRDW
jgi:RNA recognition motif-containing protein